MSQELQYRYVVKDTSGKYVDKAIVTKNPSIGDILETFQQLNFDDNPSLLQYSTPNFGDLHRTIILAAEQNRVYYRLMARKPRLISYTLLDPSLMDSLDRVDTSDVRYGGDTIPIYKTVHKDDAFNVLRSYLEAGSFPANSIWTNMNEIKHMLYSNES